MEFDLETTLYDAVEPVLIQPRIPDLQLGQVLSLDKAIATLTSAGAGADADVNAVADPQGHMSTSTGRAAPVTATADENWYESDSQYQFYDNSIFQRELVEDSVASEDGPCLQVPDLVDFEVGKQEANLLEEVAKVVLPGEEVAPLLEQAVNVQAERSDPNLNSADDGPRQEKNSGRGKENKVPGRRKPKVNWTPDLHRRFEQVVHYLGQNAIPSRISELMKVDYLTRHNIASHLQKYRSQKKHILPRRGQVATMWYQHRKPDPRGVWHGLHSNPPQILPRPPVALSWSHVGTSRWYHPSPYQHEVRGPDPSHLWQPQTVAPPWQPFNGSHQQYHLPGLGPSMSFRQQTFPLPHMQPPNIHQLYYRDDSIPHVQMYRTVQEHHEQNIITDTVANDRFLEFQPSKEKLIAAIQDTLANPLTPLPLGLKPPAMETVMTELKRQGIETLPP